MYSFPDLEPVCCSMFSSNCCFLTCIQISQEANKVVCYSYLLKNFSQFVVIHTVKGFGVVNKAAVDVFLELSCFFNDPMVIYTLPFMYFKHSCIHTILGVWVSTITLFQCHMLMTAQYYALLMFTI